MKLDEIELKTKAESITIKKRCKWILDIEGIPSYIIYNVKLPSMIRGQSNHYKPLDMEEHLSFGMYDVVDVSVQSVMEWKDKDYFRKGSFKILDNDGKVTETWSFTGLKIEEVDFGEFVYTNSDNNIIKVTLTFNDVVWQDGCESNTFKEKESNQRFVVSDNSSDFAVYLDTTFKRHT